MTILLLDDLNLAYKSKVFKDRMEEVKIEGKKHNYALWFSKSI